MVIIDKNTIYLKNLKLVKQLDNIKQENLFTTSFCTLGWINARGHF